MVKGARKNIVILKNTGSELFEEAHFILREGKICHTELDLLREANRILEENKEETKKRSGAALRALSFLLPFLLGASLAFLFLSIFWL